MHGGEHAELRRHEDAVHRELREPLGQERVHHHERGLHAARRVGEHAARAHQQPEVAQVHERCPALGLGHDVGDGALGLHALEAHRQRLVLLEGEPQRLARDRLLDHQVLEGLRDGGGADHLVLDPVPEVHFFHLERDPAQEVLDAGLG